MKTTVDHSDCTADKSTPRDTKIKWLYSQAWTVLHLGTKGTDLVCFCKGTFYELFVLFFYGVVYVSYRS